MPRLEQLDEVLSWDDFVLWRARYELQPWGELRGDMRQSVLLSYLLRPHLKRAPGRPPSVMYPYEHGPKASDFEGFTERMEAYRDWQASLRAELRKDLQWSQQLEHSHISTSS